MSITTEDKRAIDVAVEALHYVHKDSSGYQHIEIYADYREDNEALLQPAYDKRQLGFDDKDNPQHALEDFLRETICDWYPDTIAQMEYEILEKAGFDPSDEKWDELMDYLRETYPIDPDYDHFLKEDILLNIMLKTDQECNQDFGSIRDQYETMFSEELTAVQRQENLQEENGLSWLVTQQGHTMEELEKTIFEYHAFWDSPEAEGLSYDGKYEKFASTHNPFLTSICQELANMNNYMNTMTVLTRMSLYDFAEFMQPGKEIVLPKDTMIGIFNPWNGGGSTLEVALEKDLVVPSSHVYDIQIEGAKPDYQYTVDSVYGLVGNAWVKATAVRDEQPAQEATRPSLNSLIASAQMRVSDLQSQVTEQSKAIDTYEQGRG